MPGEKPVSNQNSRSTSLVPRSAKNWDGRRKTAQRRNAFEFFLLRLMRNADSARTRAWGASDVESFTWINFLPTASSRARPPAARPHSITLSARANNPSGTVTPIALAVLRLITSSNFVGCSIGMSAGLTRARA